MLAASCTKEPVQAPETSFIADGSGWINLNLNLPTTTSTKANDVFDDGTANEYAVESAYLVLFAGEANGDEGEATLRSAYELSSGDWNKDANEQITTTRNITTKIFSSNIQTNEWVYAFVMLNATAHFTVVSDKVDNVDITTLSRKSVKLTGKTFTEIKSVLLSEENVDFSNKAFVMTNMPYVPVSGASLESFNESAKSLYRIDTSKVAKTEAEAMGKEPGAIINVERVLAKVTVNLSETAKELINDPTVKFNMLGWRIDNTNPEAYVTRNLPAEPGYIKYRATTLAPYRMVAKDQVENDVWGNPVYRTYWGVDMNYNLPDDQVNLITKAGTLLNNTLMEFNAQHVNIGGDLRENGSSYYCTENTFDVKHQTVKNTTRILISAQFNNGVDFYTLSTEPNTILLKEITPDKASIQTKAIDMLSKRVNVSNWVSAYLPEGTNLYELLTISVVNDTVHLGKASLTVALNATALETVIADIAKRAEATQAWEAILDDQNEYLKDAIASQLNYYKGGVAYYQALIRHFDNTETPWEGRADMVNTTESIYDNNNEQKYLGRYGVLRNNWYDISVTGIRQIGSPAVPEVTPDPDDMVEQYIKVKINIMPWAKRVQEVIL